MGLDRGHVGWHVREARTIESEREGDAWRDGMSEPQTPAPTQQSLTPVTTVMNQAALVRCMDPVRYGVASRIAHSRSVCAPRRRGARRTVGHGDGEYYRILLRGKLLDYG